MSRRNSAAGNVRRSPFASFRPCLQVLKPRTLLCCISWKSFSATLVCSGVLFCAVFFGPRVEASFITAPTYAAGINPWSVAVGDFNGDGILDLAVANRGDFSRNGAGVSILLGIGDGTFQAPILSALDTAPFSMTVADFNNDGKLDIALENANSTTLTILLGNGDGTFQPAQIYALGSFPSSLAVQDFDGNGTLDIAVTNGGSTVSIMLGNGDGTFQTAQSYAFGPRQAAFVAAGDFNGDGHPDLAVTGVNNSDRYTVSVLLGNGDGTFRVAQKYAGIFVGGVAPSVTVGDFNGDGHPDLAVGGQTIGVGVLLGNGDGTFQPPNRFTGRSATFAVGDFNGDGVLDLVVVNFSATLSVLIGKGDGTFQAAHNHEYDVGGFIAVGDLNSDGHLDVAVANTNGTNTNGTVSILLGKGDGSFPSAAASYALGSNGIESTRSVAVADFNGDGIADLAVLSGPGVSILLGNGDGTFQTARNYDLGFYPFSVAVADFNGDGRPDLAVTGKITESGSYKVTVLLGNGDGTFRIGQSFAGGGDSVAVGDFNGDGHPDLAITNYLSNKLSIFLGNGDGTFQARKDYAVGFLSQSVAVGDFNGDGRQDLVVVGGPGSGYAELQPSTMSIFLGNGDGTFQAAQTYEAGFGTRFVAVGDLNGDGKLDVVTTNYASAGGDSHHPPAIVIENDVRVFLGNGDGTFQAAQAYAAGGGPHSVALSDFNGDGIPDLAVASGHDTVSILLGNGDGTFQAAQNYHAGIIPFSVAVGDFNRDGYPDLAVASIISPGTVTILLNAADWGR